MKSIISIFILSISIFSSNIAFAAISAEQLLKECKSASPEYCRGYISGFYDGRTTSDYGQKKFMACIPTERSGLKLAVSYEQMRLVFIKWTNKHPENLHWKDWAAMRSAFAEAWPCK